MILIVAEIKSAVLMMVLTTGKILEDNVLTHREVEGEIFIIQVTFKGIEHILMGAADFIEISHKNFRGIRDFNDLLTVQHLPGVDKALIEIDRTSILLSFVTQTLGDEVETSETSNSKDHLVYDTGWTLNPIIDQMNAL